MGGKEVGVGAGGREREPNHLMKTGTKIFFVSQKRPGTLLQPSSQSQSLSPNPHNAQTTRHRHRCSLKGDNQNVNGSHRERTVR